MRQTLARALSRHLDQAELGEAVHGHARAVARKGFTQFSQHRVLVFIAVHVDEVNDDDAAKISQSQLPRNRQRRLKIGLENGVIKTAPRYKSTGVHVDRDQRLGLVNDDVATRFQIDATF